MGSSTSICEINSWNFWIKEYGHLFLWLLLIALHGCNLYSHQDVEEYFSKSEQSNKKNVSIMYLWLYFSY